MKPAVQFEALPSDSRWDVVLVDEAQDLMNSPDMDRLDTVLEGGRAGGRWFGRRAGRKREGGCSSKNDKAHRYSLPGQVDLVRVIACVQAGR